MAWTPRAWSPGAGAPGTTEAPDESPPPAPGRDVLRDVFGEAWPPETAFVRIEEGLRTRHLQAFLDTFGRDAVLDVLGISRRTFERRRHEGRLRPDESDRFYRLVGLFSRAADVLGSAEAAREWMARAAPALGDRTPLAYARNEAGAQRVEDLLNRIEYGVYG